LISQSDSAANPERPAFEKIDKNSALANQFGAPENENPGALAGATGAKAQSEGDMLEDYTMRHEWANTLRMVIENCDPADAALIMSDALERMRPGAPVPPLLNALDEARTWAEWATPFERKAYCLASFNALSPKERTGFLAYVTRGQRNE